MRSARRERSAWRTRARRPSPSPRCPICVLTSATACASRRVADTGAMVEGRFVLILSRLAVEAKMEVSSEISGATLRNIAEAASVCQAGFMNTADASVQTAPASPKRADARRNRERLLAAAREVFAECGESTALEEIARRAGVGIGTLYRHFPNRQALLEALYVNEVEEVCRSAQHLGDGDPWQALDQWFMRLIGYLAT